MQIYLLDEKFEPAAQPVEEVESLIWTRRYYEAGTFTMKLAPGVSFDAGRIKYIHRPDTGESACVERINVTGGAVTVSGRMLESILDRRIIVGTGCVSGKAETLVRNAVRQNAIQTRQIPTLELASEAGFTDECTAEYSWDSLSDWAYGVLGGCGMSYRITHDEDDGKLYFSVVRGRDRTSGQNENGVALFSAELENLASLEYERYDGDARNTAYVRSGDGYIEVCGDGSEGFERRELYVSARDITFGGEDASTLKSQLIARGEATLKKYNVSEKVSGVALSGGSLRYRLNYDLGDLCEVRIDETGDVFGVRITSVDEVYEKGTFTAYPFFGGNEDTLRSYIRRELERSR